MKQAFICDYCRTPIGRYGGALSAVRADDLAATALRALVRRHEQVDAQHIDEVVFGCANQAGEDNRNVARMAVLLAGLPLQVPATTVNRLCGSGMDAVITAARIIRSGEAEVVVAGGVESMSRAPFVMPKASAAFSRASEVHDTTIGWRFINPLMRARYGVDSMPETAENVAADFAVSRERQDAFAAHSQHKAEVARISGRLAREITPVSVAQRKGDAALVDTDEHPRPATTTAQLAALTTPFRAGGTVTAGNSSGVNDGAAALLVASEAAVKRYELQPLARVVAAAAAGVAPRVMGIGPVPAVTKLLHRSNLQTDQLATIELNEAFAAQAIASLDQLGIAPDDARVNPNGGAIALGHPLGMSGARITGSAALQLKLNQQRYALAAMCIGVGQGIAIALEGC